MPTSAGVPVDHVTAHANRILLVLPSFERGGGEHVLLQLANLFLAAGREVHLAVLLGGGPLRTLVPEDVVLHEVMAAGDAPRGMALVCNALPKLTSLIRTIRPHAVLSTLTGTNLLVVLACRWARTKARLILREASSLVNTKNVLIRQAMRWLYRRADGVVAVSEGVAQDLRRLGLPDSRIYVIRNPVDEERLRELATARLPPDVQDKGSYVVSVGRLTEAKDYPTLLRAYAICASRRSHHLIIVGEGEQRTNLESLAKELGIADRVLLTGAMDNPHSVVASAALHVLSSRWEGYPNVLLEALALGVPVVSTDCPHGPREILDDGCYGRLVPVGDAFALARAMDAELEQPSREGGSVVASHGPSVIASLFLALMDGSAEEEQS